MVFDEPNMSDSGLLISVEDLINQAMGPQEMNVINFKVLQMVLHILARQQRLLEQRVEIRISDIAPPRQKVKKEKIIEESETSIPKSPRSPKGRMTDIKEERESKKEKEQREKEKAEKLAQKAKEIEEKEKDRAERAALKEKQKAQKLTLKEQEKLEKLERKEKERAERQAQKEQEKAEKQSQKEQERAEKYSQKEKEKAERQVQKEQEKAERMSQKEKEKAEKLSQREQEKAEKLTQKEKEKAEKLSQKEQEKLEKQAQKEQEKAGKQAQKEQEKAEKLDQKEKDKAEKLSQKEKEKAEKLSQKEKEKAEKLAQKEREKMEKAALKEKEKAEKSPREKKKPLPSDTSIAISEEKRGKEKVLIVEKGPTTRPETYSRGSIEVVTQSQFALLESAVKELKDLVAPPMPLKLPDNETLRSDLARGSASLQDTMRAMQVDARVLAAEQAITRMTGLLLAIAGAEPDDLDNLLDEVEQKRAAAEAEAAAALKSRPSSARKSVLIDPSAKLSEATGMARLMSRMSTASMRPSMSIMRKPSSSKTSSDAAPVTHDEMEDSINELREELIKAMNTMTNKATASADNALYTAKNVADKLDIALSLDSRISTLHSLATDYAEQLHGFDAGLATQMQSFREQMVQMRGDLKSGLTLLESVNNNAETAAVTELTERYQDLVTELDATLHAHRALTKFQTQLANELHSLVECVEMLREQKADRDEVVDGLRDKADTSRLAGLLTESEFATVRADLERRLAVCHDKFQRQDNVWMTAIKDLNKITDGKSEIIDLLSARDELQKELQVLHQRLQVLAAVLGEPNAAVVKRKLGVGAACAACGAPALMSPRDATRGAPPRLPALRAPPHQPDEEGEVCLKEWMPPDRPDDRHICHRWCGGSHTLVAGATRRERAPPPEPTAPTKRYTGYGTDGRLYMLEDELQPCIECNEMNAKVAADVPALDLGAGDQNPQ